MRGVFLGMLWIAFLSGCSRGPRSIERPEIDFPQAAVQAITECDADGDGNVTRGEADKVPGLASTFDLADENDDGLLDANELQQRFQQIVERTPALMVVTFEIWRGGQPLENALVELVPEPFLGNAFKSAQATTDELGMAFMSLSEQDLPFPGCPPGVRAGLYRVKITSNTNVIPAKYNTATTLGLDVSNDAATLRKPSVRIEID